MAAKIKNGAKSKNGAKIKSRKLTSDWRLHWNRWWWCDDDHRVGECRQYSSSRRDLNKNILGSSLKKNELSELRTSAHEQLSASLETLKGDNTLAIDVNSNSQGGWERSGHGGSSRRVAQGGRGNLTQLSGWDHHSRGRRRVGRVRQRRRQGGRRGLCHTRRGRGRGRKMIGHRDRHWRSKRRHRDLQKKRNQPMKPHKSSFERTAHTADNGITLVSICKT